MKDTLSIRKTLHPIDTLLRSLGCVIVLAGLSFSQLSLAKDPIKLTWKNGDAMTGELLPSDSKAIRWKSSMFNEPFSLSPDYLMAVVLPPAEKDATPGPFRVSLSNGDVLTGELISIDAGKIVLKSDRFDQEISVARKFVSTIDRINDQSIAYAGPNTSKGWISVGRERKIGDWFATPSGQLSTRRWHGDAFHEIKFPELSETEVTLSTIQGRLDFTLGFFQQANLGPRIETWDDVLVLTYGTKFETIQLLKDDTEELTFRIFWDQKKGNMAVHDGTGKKLATLSGLNEKLETKASTRRSTNAKNPKAKGFSIQNKSLSLKVSTLRVRSWNGSAPPIIEYKKNHTALADGSALYQAVESASGGKLKLKGKSSIALSGVRRIIINDDLKQPFATTSKDLDARLTWFDGTGISGFLDTVDPAKVKIKTLWSDAPVVASLMNARKLAFFTENKPAEIPTDELQVNGAKFRGSIEPGSNTADPNTLIAWRPIGATNASSLATGILSRVVRAEAKEAGFIGFGRIYLDNYEILSGKLISIDNEKVHFESDYSGPVGIDKDSILAIDIESGGGDMTDFDDPGWEAFPKEDKADSVVIEDEKVILKQGSFGHRTLLAGNEIKFTAEWKSPHVGSVTMRLFLSDFDEGAASTDILFAAQGSRLYLGEMKAGGAFQFSGERAELSNGKAEIRIAIATKKIEVFVNGSKAVTIPTSPSRQSGNGLLFKEGGGWEGWNRDDSQLTISKFEISRSPGYIPSRIIDSKAKREALIVPRFQKETPASHVLIAPNGDMLRGRLVAASENSIRFISKMDTFDLPRERVATIISLKKPETEGDDEKNKDDKNEIDPFSDKNHAELARYNFKPTHRFVLHDGSRLSLIAKEIKRDKFIGTSMLLGDCEIPLRAVREIRHGEPTPNEKKEYKNIAYSDWILEFAKEPVIPTDDGGESSPLIGSKPKDFKLTMLDDSEFTLADQKGKVVVLDFWATWCGPCIRAMPEIFDAVGRFGEDDLSFLAVNQAETKPVIDAFLKRRQWEGIPVALDSTQTVGNQFEVTGIPHTVLIDQEGKIVWVHSGYKEGMGEALAAAIEKALSDESE